MDYRTFFQSQDLGGILEIVVWNNSLRAYVISFGLFLFFSLFFRIFRRFILKKFSQIAKKTTTTLDDAFCEFVEGIPGYFYYYIALYIALHFLEIGEMPAKIFLAILTVLVVLQLMRVAQFVTDFLFERLAEKNGKDEGYITAVNGVNIVIRIVLWVIAVLLILSNLGFDVSTLAASLGIGGIAVALAVQNILGDIFSSFSLYFDKPFKIGDYVQVGKDSGTVKDIGLKTTRIETLQGEQLVIPNRELTSSRVQNFKTMKKRRVMFTFGVEYDTPLAKLKKIPAMIATIISKVEKVEFDRAHFKSFGDFSLNFEVVYYVMSSEYLDYMNANQEINFEIKETFEKEAITMAFPTQTLYVHKSTADSAH